ncbi:MAG: O-methyltransferase, partial [Methyloligellaceae bacterium]
VEGRELYDHIVETRPANCLELGHAHGVSTIYMAAALDETGQGSLDTVDLHTSVDREPNLETLLAGSNLARIVNIHREKNSYNWFLKTKIQNQTRNGRCKPCYDFCFFDGAKNWTIDGFAFFLVDKLLHAGGWLLFDDLKWSYGKVKGRKSSDGVTLRSLSEEEIREPHVELIFRSLVMQHPEYSNFRIQDDWWGWAQKNGEENRTLKTGRMKGAGPAPV